MNKIWYLLLLVSIISVGAVGDKIIESLDTGADIPVKNYPLGWVYEQYPMINDSITGRGNNSPCGNLEGDISDVLVGVWLRIDPLDGAFFRTEGSNAKQFDPVNVNLLQLQAEQKHSHDHTHNHTHLLNEHSHGDHRHEHNHNAHIPSKRMKGGKSGSFQLIDNNDDGGDTSQKVRTDARNYGPSYGDSYSGANGESGNINILAVKDYYQPDAEMDSENATETRPKNYVMGFWQKIAQYSPEMENIKECIITELIYENEYEEITTEFVDKQGNYLKTETTQRLISRTPKLDSDGNYILRRL